MKIIGLDVGEKRIGVAKVDSSTRIALPVGYLLADGSEWQEMARIANLNNTKTFVVGLPRSNEGNETKQSAYVRGFVATLCEKIPGVTVYFQDESLTSVEAERRLKASRKKYERGDIDAEAATIILQDFVESLKARGGDLTGVECVRSAYDFSEKAKKHPKSGKKVIIGLIIGFTVAGLATGGITAAVAIREQQLKERAEMFAAMEAEMQPDVFNFTIRPGETIFDVKKSLVAAGYTAAEVEAAFSYDYSTEEGLEFLSGRPSGASLEGYLYPETHEFYADADAKTIVRTFLVEMGRIIRENNLSEKYAGQGLTLNEGITLASVVQKEAGATEQPGVARVFLNRLDLGMAMGSDVTVSYALDVIDPERQVYTDNAAALEVESCYNTRKNAGLPCGPISNPGLSALLAVAEPAESDYLFFLTGDDGTMHYAHTEGEHLQNASLYCQKLCNVSL